MKIASNLRFLRKKNGYTQEALSQMIAKTSITISDYEKGKSTPPLEVALKFCEIFRIDLNQLVTVDLERESIVQKTGEDPRPDSLPNYEALQRINQLQSYRLSELEREIREHAPELAGRLGLR